MGPLSRTLALAMGVALARSPVAQAVERLEGEASARPYGRDASYGYGHRPIHAVELAFSPESVWLAYRGRIRRGKGTVTLGVLGNDRDDAAFLVQLQRFGEPTRAVPLGLGVGAGFYGIRLDQPDERVYALTLSAHADIAWDTPWPLYWTAEVAYAPDIATTAEADALVDASTRLEVELSEFAGAFLGVRLLDLGLDGGGHRELESDVHVGVRLWL